MLVTALLLPAFLLGQGGRFAGVVRCTPRMDAAVSKTPNHGPYSLLGDPPEGADVGAVLAILAERAEAKQERDFETADALQAKLNEMGVTVDDRKRTWEAAEGGIAGYVLKGDAPPGLDMDAARAIFAKRAEAKRARDFDTADVFQAELRQMGIYVDDRKKTWEQAVNPDAPYTLQGRPPAGVDVEEVNARLAARRDAKKNKDFALADEIQDELLAKGVRIFDSKRAWGAIRVEPKAFELKGAAPEGVDVAVVEAMLAKRVDAKKVKDWATSDELQGELLKMGVYVNDKTRLH